MSLTEKILIPLISKYITKTDVDEDSGFVGIYTSDPEKPNDYNTIYFAVDANVRNEKSMDRARRFALCPDITQTYTRYINGKPTKVYKFSIPKRLKNVCENYISLSVEDKTQILQFWGLLDDVTKVLLLNNIVSLDMNIPMPEDKESSHISELFIPDNGLCINKKEDGVK